MKKISFFLFFAFLLCEINSHAQKQTILSTIDGKVVNNPAQPMRASDLNAILKSILNYPVDTVWFSGDTLKYKVSGVTKSFRFTGYQDSLATTVKTYGSYTNPSWIYSIPYSKITGTPSDLPPSGSAGGDLSGSYPNPAVARLNGQLPSYYVDRVNHTGTQAQSTIVNLADSLDAIRVRNNAKLAITDAASIYITISRTLDSLAAIQARIQSKEPLLGFTPVPNTRTINGYALNGNITLNKSDVGLGNVDNTSDVNKPISTATQTALDGKVPTSRTINGYALTSNITLTKSDVGLSNVPNTDATNATNITSGTLPDARLSANVTVQGNTFNSANQLVKLDGSGKLPTSTIPSLALVETFVVGSQAAMLALSAQMGDVAVRTDNNRSYILQSEPATTLSNWVQLLVPDSETDPVYTASSWFSTTNNASNWNTAYSWGNHASAGYATASRTITINGTTYDLTVNRSWTVGDVRTDGSYSNPSWITALAWSKLTGVPSTFTPSAHTHPYSDLTGTVPTWNQNTTGNAATSTNSTLWASNPYSGGAIVTPTLMMMYESTVSAWRAGTQSDVRTFLGLGSNAYTSTQFLPLTGGTLTGLLTAPGFTSTANISISTGHITMTTNIDHYIDMRSASAWNYRMRTLNDDFIIQDAAGTEFVRLYYNGGSGNQYAWLRNTRIGGTLTTDGDVTVITGATSQISVVSPGNYSWRMTGTATQMQFKRDNTVMGYFDINNNLSISGAYYGSGTGLTGTASSLNIGGNAATVTNGVYTNTTQTISGEKTFSSTYTYVNTLRASADVIAYYSSDRRLKNNIKPINNALGMIDQIGGYSYTWNNKQEVYTGRDYGVIAQEIEQIMPEAVTTRANGYKAVKYERLIPLLIQAVKELKHEIELLKK